MHLSVRSLSQQLRQCAPSTRSLSGLWQRPGPLTQSPVSASVHAARASVYRITVGTSARLPSLIKEQFHLPLSLPFASAALTILYLSHCPTDLFTLPVIQIPLSFLFFLYLDTVFIYIFDTTSYFLPISPFCSVSRCKVEKKTGKVEALSNSFMSSVVELGAKKGTWCWFTELQWKHCLCVYELIQMEKEQMSYLLINLHSI